MNESWRQAWDCLGAIILLFQLFLHLTVLSRLPMKLQLHWCRSAYIVLVLNSYQVYRTGNSLSTTGIMGPTLCSNVQVFQWKNKWVGQSNCQLLGWKLCPWCSETLYHNNIHCGYQETHKSMWLLPLRYATHHPYTAMRVVSYVYILLLYQL